MSDTISTAQRERGAAYGGGTLPEAAGSLLDAVAALDPADGRWHVWGPLVSVAATRLREAIGAPVVGDVRAGAPPIVRQRDLAEAARGLLARDVQVADRGAAAGFVALVLDVTVALGCTAADTSHQEEHRERADPAARPSGRHPGRGGRRAARPQGLAAVRPAAARGRAGQP